MQMPQMCLAPQEGFVRAGRDSEHRPGEVKLHVCNLPYSTSHWQIGALFAVYGEVLEAFVFKRPNMQNGSRSALVRMATNESATAAAADLDQTVWRGCVLRVRRSHYDENQDTNDAASNAGSSAIKKSRSRRNRRAAERKSKKADNAGCSNADADAAYGFESLDDTTAAATHCHMPLPPLPRPFTTTTTAESVVGQLLLPPRSPAAASTSTATPTPTTPLSLAPSSVSLSALASLSTDDNTMTLLERCTSFVHDPYSYAIWGHHTHTADAAPSSDCE